MAEAASDVSYEQIHYEGTFFRAMYYIFSPFVSTRRSAVFAGLLPRLLERLKIGFSLEAAVCDSFLRVLFVFCGGSGFVRGLRLLIWFSDRPGGKTLGRWVESLFGIGSLRKFGFGKRSWI